MPRVTMTTGDYPDERAWSLISNHGHALICIAEQPDIRIWGLAERIGVRERSAQRILNQLVDAGYLARHDHENHGTRSTYTRRRPPTPTPSVIWSTRSPVRPTPLNVTTSRVPPGGSRHPPAAGRDRPGQTIDRIRWSARRYASLTDQANRFTNAKGDEPPAARRHGSSEEVSWDFLRSQGAGHAVRAVLLHGDLACLSAACPPPNCKASGFWQTARAYIDVAVMGLHVSRPCGPLDEPARGLLLRGRARRHRRARRRCHRYEPRRDGIPRAPARPLNRRLPSCVRGLVGSNNQPKVISCKGPWTVRIG